ncbi:uncharacterized protein TNCV_2761621 [Trichonephila clavipes]|nr:uncharacterized protein TNCV_2761621 [Trichonephila clavipes]
MSSFKKYKCLTISEKQKVIESVEEGERKVDVAKAFEIPLSSFSTILKNEEKFFSASSSREGDHNNTESDEDESEELTPVTLSEAKVSLNTLRNFPLQNYVDVDILQASFVLEESIDKELWFQQDDATCHTARAKIDLLKDTFGDRLISRFGPVNWPPRSCDLTPLDYFL